MSKRKLRIIAGVSLAVIFGAIAWTNESIDYLSKLGFQNINPAYILLSTTFLMVFALVWALWEILEK